jgi:hypothetical protein
LRLSLPSITSFLHYLTVTFEVVDIAIVSNEDAIEHQQQWSLSGMLTFRQFVFFAVVDVKFDFYLTLNLLA